MQHSLFPAHVYPASNFPARIFLGRECSPFPVQLSDVPTQSTQTWTLNKADTNERHPFHMVAQPVILFSPSPLKKLPSLTLCECGYHFFTVSSKIGYDHRTEPTQNWEINVGSSCLGTNVPTFATARKNRKIFRGGFRKCGSTHWPVQEARFCPQVVKVFIFKHRLLHVD